MLHCTYFSCTWLLLHMTCTLTAFNVHLIILHLHLTSLHCTQLNCIALDCTCTYCTCAWQHSHLTAFAHDLHLTALALDCTALHCTALALDSTCTRLHLTCTCTWLHCIALALNLHLTALGFDVTYLHLHLSALNLYLTALGCTLLNNYNLLSSHYWSYSARMSKWGRGEIHLFSLCENKFLYLFSWFPAAGISHIAFVRSWSAVPWYVVFKNKMRNL